jgi:hypothetical protein
VFDFGGRGGDPFVTVALRGSLLDIACRGGLFSVLKLARSASSLLTASHAAAV